MHQTTEPSIGEDVKQPELSYTAGGGNAEWYKKCFGGLGQCLLKLSMCLGWEPPVAFLGIDSTETSV